jgi:hypothetical protein
MVEDVPKPDDLRKADKRRKCSECQRVFICIEGKV